MEHLLSEFDILYELFNILYELLQLKAAYINDRKKYLSSLDPDKWKRCSRCDNYFHIDDLINDITVDYTQSLITLDRFCRSCLNKRYYLK